MKKWVGEERLWGAGRLGEWSTVLWRPRGWKTKGSGILKFVRPKFFPGNWKFRGSGLRISRIHYIILILTVTESREVEWSLKHNFSNFLISGLKTKTENTDPAFFFSENTKAHHNGNNFPVNAFLKTEIWFSWSRKYNSAIQTKFKINILFDLLNVADFNRKWCQSTPISYSSSIRTTE